MHKDRHDSILTGWFYAQNKVYLHAGAHPKGRGGCWVAAPSTTNKIKKKTDFVNMVISNVSFDLPYSQNQPLKSGDD